MSNQGRIVLWIGLFLIAMQFVQGWSVIRNTIFTPGSGSGGTGGGGGNETKPPYSLFPGHFGPFGPGGVWPFSLIAHQTPSNVRV